MNTMIESSVENRTIFCGDNIDMLQGINSECIDLIYLDPPFNKNKQFIAPIGTSAEGTGFSDVFSEKDLNKAWLTTIQEDHPALFQYLNSTKLMGRRCNFAYLVYMTICLSECHRVLKPTGSIYLHCDSTMSHYLKIIMDCIFGEDNFRNEIIWCYKSGGASPKRHFSKKHDVILWYTISNSYTFHPQTEKSYNRELKPYGFKGVEEFCDEIGWYTLVGTKDYWNIAAVGRTSSERTGYPTQKPLALLQRIIVASSNENDMVLDPFCGCATTCIAAEQLNRKWVGIDISAMTYDLVKNRLTEGPIDPDNVSTNQFVIHRRTDPPKRSDQSTDYQEQKFVYVVSHPRFPGEYKVGIAKNWKSSLNFYQASDPEKQYKLEFKFETPWFRSTKFHIHDKFENKHEWVKGNLKDIIDEIKNYKPGDNSTH